MNHVRSMWVLVYVCRKESMYNEIYVIINSAFNLAASELPLLLESNICVGSQQLSLAGRVCESKREGGEV